MQTVDHKTAWERAEVLQDEETSREGTAGARENVRKTIFIISDKRNLSLQIIVEQLSANKKQIVHFYIEPWKSALISNDIYVNTFAAVKRFLFI